MRLRNTIEYLGIWEGLYNLDFKPIEFDRFLHEAGSNALQNVRRSAYLTSSLVYFGVQWVTVLFCWHKLNLLNV
jgi:hypothetical protein